VVLVVSFVKDPVQLVLFHRRQGDLQKSDALFEHFIEWQLNVLSHKRALYLISIENCISIAI